jgi:hypothetical protein
MRIALLISLLVAWPFAALAAGDAQCDAKPFTLNKPKPTAQKPAETAQAAKTKPAAPKAAPKTTQAKPKLIGDCKEPKKG